MIRFYRFMSESDFKHLALKELIPNGFSNDGVNITLPEGSNDKIPTQKQIDDKIAELKVEYKKQAYARSRAEAYDPITEQLDQIYWDMDGWKAKIKAVKDKYPKP